MKLLDFPPGTCGRVTVEFQPDTWDEFDKTVAWLIKNGVPLGRGWAYSEEGRQLVQVRRGIPYAGGKIVQNTHSNKYGHVDGEEMGVHYEVNFPEILRIH